MLIKKQQLWRVDGRHYKSKSLTLSAREKSDRLMHAIFKSHIQRTELFTKQFLFFFAYVREPAAFGTCESHIFFNGHARSSAAHGILKQMTDFFCSYIVWLKCYILAVKNDLSLISVEGTADCIKQRRFTSTVCTDDGNKIAFI